ncbi:hypothetical protein I4I73_31090 [Pseudonocardia sp. KRD-184]|uniref:Peptidase inhibitor family I36 n=1 Tax=Pseudonocardia oceani TaxID=2792013 RepID=A0ABS6UEF9_9PSEU|nr:hypothetical protein [Pseudonocardia oceani]MBW0093803.1 hypothetical protein [Pseudonocardia oceani]MBW0100431.1 hypothetical protein [Pseudonocardia oceani]MBW0113164.1 hypothetical protein [Pseudonocardia oceani]MBW0121668.1 hypothetical protein [Pseudonocardia oceani]MBW0130630.1 hypothetical protein [Pseudonocardia oceani]
MHRFLNATAATAAAMSLSLLLAPAAIASTGGDNSDAAKLCQGGGYADYQRSDGTRFANEGACVSYAARGGQLVNLPVVTRSVVVSFATTSNSDFCGVVLTLTGFDPLTSYPVDTVLDRGLPTLEYYPRTVVTDADGAFSGVLFTYIDGPGIYFSSTVDGVTSSKELINC